MKLKKPSKKNKPKSKREETPHVHRAALAVGVLAAVTAAACHSGGAASLACKVVL